ncbi:MAG: hypothetical protein KGD63_01230 [Candidatus Lokiarchaeota archaeon]|nr:hypothetical protein [Candidatus Lokiarchaeota archaeon]
MKIILDEIAKFLQNDEWILWKRIKTVNLLKFIYNLLPITIILIILLFFILILMLFVIWIMIIIIPFILFGLFFCISAIKEGYKNLKNILGLSDTELRNYPSYDIITNKSYIKKDFYFLKDTEFSYFVPDSVKIINNIFFLKMDYIEKIIVDLKYKTIEILVRGDDDILIREIYIEYSESNLFQIKRTITEILKFEKIKENREFIFYRRKN